jgi:tyrosine-protein phosphatase SIW14
MMKTRRLMMGPKWAAVVVSIALVAGTGAGCAGPRSRVSDAERPTPAVLKPLSHKAEGPFDDHVPGIKNFGFVSADVWRGAKPSREGLRHLAAMGVKTIIDLQMDDESADVPECVKYVPIRVTLWAADKVNVAKVLETLKDCPKPVFIHCLQGRDRCGLAVAAYRLDQGMSGDEAIRELEQFGVNFVYNGPIKKRIRQLEKERRSATAAAESE